MCHWMGSHFHSWIDYNGVTLLVELGQTNLISGSMNFFQNLKGLSVGEKRQNKKKNPQYFELASIINKSSLLHVGQTLHPCSDFSKFAFKMCQYAEINVTLKQK